MKNKDFILLLMFLLYGVTSYSQQSYQGTQYMLNPYMYNPAYAGMTFTMDVNINIRNQYVGLADNPSTQSINAYLPLYTINGAAGFKIDNEQLGAIRKTGVHASLSRIFDSSAGILAVALQAGVSQYAVDGSSLITPDGNYTGGVIDHQDPILSVAQVAGVVPQFTLGVFYKSRFFEAGIDIQQLISIPVDLETKEYDLIPHMDFYFQYKRRIGNEFILKPSFLVKANQNWLQADFSVLIEHSSNFFGGLSVRGYGSSSFDAIAAIVGMKLNEHITLSYSYDAGLSVLKKVNEGSHEIILRYSLNRLIGAAADPKIIYNPRNL